MQNQGREGQTSGKDSVQNYKVWLLIQHETSIWSSVSSQY